MCGIAGFIGKKTYFPKKENIESCLKAMHLRRGPDAYGTKTVHKKDYSFTFLHSRLSLIDLKERSNQPMEDSQGIISFNGEIYNFLELKKICEERGAKFETSSDTEVLLKILNIFGAEGLKKLDGDWALSYYNKKLDKIILSKDRFSIRPLFYFDNGKEFYFASTIAHAMLLMGRKVKMNFERIVNYIAFGFKGTNLDPDTYFSGFKKFPYAQYLEFDRGKKKAFVKYWSNIPKINYKLNYNQSVGLIRERVSESVKLRLRTDKNIGCMLSAGIDSSSVAAIVKKKLNQDIKYFSYKPNYKDYDESELIKQNIQSLDASNNHTFVNFDGGDSVGTLRDIIFEAALPFNAPSDWLFHVLCKKMKEQHCTSFFTGCAGDDIFSGNYIDHLNYLVSVYKDKVKFDKAYSSWTKNIKPLVRSPHLKDFNKYLQKHLNENIASWHEKHLVNENLNFKVPKVEDRKLKNYSEDFFRNELCRGIFDAAVPAHVLNNDQIAMFHSLEGRYPFLSHHVYEAANSIPSDHLLKDSRTKSVLRDAVKDMIPEAICESKNKIGFFMDFKEVFKTNTNEFEDVLFQHKELNNLFHVDKFRKKLKSDDEIIMADQKLIFSALNISILLEKYSW
tara:strand:- start:1318 stop:3174 length:1857 start_codon:yes stop_codon:yes gene_type:complete